VHTLPGTEEVDDGSADDNAEDDDDIAPKSKKQKVTASITQAKRNGKGKDKGKSQTDVSRDSGRGPRVRWVRESEVENQKYVYCPGQIGLLQGH
jgi:hypothetical protein